MDQIIQNAPARSNLYKDLKKNMIDFSFNNNIKNNASTRTHSSKQLQYFRRLG